MADDSTSRVSIITCCYNSGRTIEATIRSVLAQDHGDIEYIVVDGASTDDTMAVVGRYADRIARIVSEPDNGIYDAFNKGVGLATGDIVGFLHSDDFYTSPAAVSTLVSALQGEAADGVYADLVYVSPSDPTRVVRRWKAGRYRPGLFLRGWMPPHPTLFLRRELYDRYGSYRTDLGSAADYELVLRFIHVHGISLAYVPEIVVGMRTGGASNASLAGRLRANRNDQRAWTVNGLRPPWYTLILKPLSKVGQFLP